MPSIPLIARSSLFGNPDRLSPALSPAGDEVAFLAPLADRLTGWIQDLRTGEARPLDNPALSGVRTLAWTFDGRWLLCARDHDGDENTHLLRVDPRTGDATDLTPFDGVQARIIALSRTFPGTILVGLNRRQRALHDVYRLDLATGELALVAENPGFTSWIADDDLVLRAAVRPADRAGLTVLVPDGESWRVLHTAEHEDSTLLRVVGSIHNGRKLLVLSSVDAETVRLLRLDVSGGAAEVLFEDPDHDVTGVGTAPGEGTAQFVVVQRERTDIEVLDERLAADFGALRSARPGDLSVLSRDHTDRHWLVCYNLSDGPAEYHCYDRETGTIELLFTHSAALRDVPLSPVEPFVFAARDGLTLHGYLTFPRGAERTGLPAVVLVHGGPWSRDVWGYRAETQWLANRGYLVVQVNFRGSTGYGKRFVNAGDRQWGAAMQEDLLDAVEYVRAKGFADPARIAIYGGSYGGYAALVAATSGTTEFRCAVAVAAPSDLRTFLASIPPQWRVVADRLGRRIGDPVTEADFLWSRSPLAHVERLAVPLLIAQGANDPRVLRQESEQIVAELRRRGIPHEYLLFSDEGHGFVKPANRMRFYAAAERFLAQHLGGRAEPDDMA